MRKYQLIAFDFYLYFKRALVYKYGIEKIKYKREKKIGIGKRILKCEILKGLGDIINCRLWADLVASMYCDIHLDLRKQKVEKFQTLIQDSLIKAIAAFLNVLQTVCEPRMRQKKIIRHSNLQLQKLTSNPPSNLQSSL